MAWRVLAVGVNGGTDDLSPLEHADKDAVGLCGWFEDAFGRHRTSPLEYCEKLVPPTRGDLIDALAHLAEASEDGDRCVVYWAGHSSDGALVVADGETVDSADIAEAVSGITAGADVLFILDVCDGGQIADEISRRLPSDFASATTFVSLGHPESGKAWDGAFWRGLQQAWSTGVVSGEATDTTSPFIGLTAVLNAIGDEAVWVEVSPRHGSWKLPNPNLDLPPEPYVDHPSWKTFHPDTWVGLSGRNSEIALLESWALDGCLSRPVAIVTGKPGSGKSAVLNHVAVATEFKRPADAAASCRQARVEDLVTGIGAMFGAVPKSVGELIEVLDRQDSRPLIVLDGLDEAVEPGDVGNMISEIASSPRRGGPAAHLIVSSRESGLEATGLRNTDGVEVIDLDLDASAVSKAIDKHVHRRIEMWSVTLPREEKYDDLRESLDTPTIKGVAASISEWSGFSFLMAEEILRTVLKDCYDPDRTPGSIHTLSEAIGPWRRENLSGMHDIHAHAIRQRVEWKVGDPPDISAVAVVETAVETLLQVMAWSLGSNGITRPPISGVYRQLWPIVAAGKGLNEVQMHQMNAPFVDAWEILADYRVESPMVVDHLGRTASAFQLSSQVYVDIHRSRLIGWVRNQQLDDDELGAEGYINSAFLDGLLVGIER